MEPEHHELFFVFYQYCKSEIECTNLISEAEMIHPDALNVLTVALEWLDDLCPWSTTFANSTRLSKYCFREQ